MRILYFSILLFSLLSTLNSCFILGQAIYGEDDCRLYYIYSEDPSTRFRTLEWESSYCGAGGGLTRMQWDSKYAKLRDANPETYYSQSIFEYKDGSSYTFDGYQGYVGNDSPFGW